MSVVIEWVEKNLFPVKGAEILMNDLRQAAIDSLELPPRAWPKWRFEKALADAGYRIAARGRKDQPRPMVLDVWWTETTAEQEQAQQGARELAKQTAFNEAIRRHSGYWSPWPYAHSGPLKTFLMRETSDDSTANVIPYEEIAARYADAIPEKYRAEISPALIRRALAIFSLGYPTDNGVMRRRWGRPDTIDRVPQGTPDPEAHEDEVHLILEGQKIIDHIERN